MSQNNLQETIEEIIEANIYEAQKGMMFNRTKCVEAILQAVRDVVPEAQKDYNGKELSTDFDNYEAGYNQCRLDILKRVGRW